jgi:hypothetical protein
MGRKSLVVKTLAVCVGLVGLVQAEYINGVITGAATDQQGLHSTTAWQSLGVESIGSVNTNSTNWWLGANGDGAKTTNNGVIWSTDGINFNNTDFEFEVGQKVDFKVFVYKEYAGGHQFDGLKVWVNDELTVGAIIPSNSSNPYYVTDSDNDAAIFDRAEWTGTGPTNRIRQSFTPVIFSHTVSNQDLLNGSFDLTARVSCSNDISWLYNGSAIDDITKRPKVSLSDWNAFGKNTSFTDNSRYKGADGNWYTPQKNGQGETEKYRFTVTPTNVPEPSLLTLLGCGLLGLVFVRRRK